MADYRKKINEVKQKAEDLYNKVPFYVRALPDMKESQKIQAEVFSLLDEINEKLKGK